MERGKSWIAAVALSLMVSAPDGLAAQEFYAGKTIQIVVGGPAGGGFDIYARIIARHLGKHIPGKPSVIVQNMPGAGMSIAANHVYRAKPDGLTIAHWIGGLILQQITGNPAINFDGRKIVWLGVPVADRLVCAFTRDSAVATMDDWLRSKTPKKLGAMAPGTAYSDIARLLKAGLNPPSRIIEGYQGTAPLRLAMKGGEIDGLCGWGWKSLKTIARDDLTSGDLKVVLQVALERHPELKDIPAVAEYAGNERARKLWQVGDYIHGSLQRPYSLPPGVPEDRVALLRKAFLDTLKDPALLEEANKAQTDVDPIDGVTTTKMIGELYDMKPELVTELKTILTPK
jgi:tripartite-type tricarboxylate transporter receptor subunit TctC